MRNHVRAQRRSIGTVHRTVATVTPPLVRRAQRAAADVGDWTEAGRPIRDHHAHIPFQFAIYTNTVRGDIRLPFVEGRDDDFNELELIDRATAKLEIDVNE